MQTHENSKIIFNEPYAAAQSLKNLWTRLASTYGCIRVVLSAETLFIKPHWYAGWLLWVLRLDLDHAIGIARIVNIRELGMWFNRGKIEVHFRTSDGNDRILLLYLKKYLEFRRAVKKAKGSEY
jgi:hypothetical protein